MNALAETDGRSQERKRPGTTEWEVVDDDGDSVLDVLGDEYTLTALAEVVDEPLSVSTVAERTEMSRTTAFRRLDRLEDLGLVEETECRDGSSGLHRYTVYRATADGIAVEFTEDGFRIELARETAEDGTPACRRSSAAD